MPPAIVWSWSVRFAVTCSPVVGLACVPLVAPPAVWQLVHEVVAFHAGVAMPLWQPASELALQAVDDPDPVWARLTVAVPLTGLWAAVLSGWQKSQLALSAAQLFAV